MRQQQNARGGPSRKRGQAFTQAYFRPPVLTALGIYFRPGGKTG
jgi:hypothetical protein